MEYAKCRSCDAPIIWARSATTDSLMPLNAEPVEGGNIAIVDGKAVVKKGDLFEESIQGPFYVSRSATCPNAKKYRKKAD